jgi:F0F1-type ATP synthase assembly protein I
VKSAFWTPAVPVPRDSRPPMVVAMQWVHRLTTISFGMVLPVVGGYFADRQWGTTPVLVLVGATLGFAWSLWQLIRIAKRSADDR